MKKNKGIVILEDSYDDSLPINDELNHCFEELLLILFKAFKELNIINDDKCIYYQRNANKTSILGVKLISGKDEEVNNYVFFGGDATYYKEQCSCDVFMYANGKCSQLACSLSNLVVKDIIYFFDSIEDILHSKGYADISFIKRISLGEAKNKKTKKGFKRLLKELIKKDKE